MLAGNMYMARSSLEMEVVNIALSSSCPFLFWQYLHIHCRCQNHFRPTNILGRWGMPYIHFFILPPSRVHSSVINKCSVFTKWILSYFVFKVLWLTLVYLIFILEVWDLLMTSHNWRSWAWRDWITCLKRHEVTIHKRNITLSTYLYNFNFIIIKTDPIEHTIFTQHINKK